GGEAPEQVGWPDGAGRQYPKCPGCGCEASLFSVITEGEEVLGPPGETIMPFVSKTEYETSSGRKLVMVHADMCPQCGLLRGRQVTKQGMSARTRVQRHGIILPGQGN
ncbi:hypothetical protein LCGC14_2270070, partial [marine sediment metagenome]